MTGTACYIYGPAGRLAKRTTINSESNTFYYHTDHLGSSKLVTDSDRNIVSAISYHPFGESDTEEGEEHYLFTEKEKDETGLYYYGARYYDPETGQFISRDLLSGQMKSPQTLNRYTYVLNNPLKYRDPNGLEQAGALLGKSDYPGQGASFESGYMYVYWSHNPDWIGTDQWTGNFTCLFAMVALVLGFAGLMEFGPSILIKLSVLKPAVIDRIVGLLKTVYTFYKGLKPWEKWLVRIAVADIIKDIAREQLGIEAWNVDLIYSGINVIVWLDTGVQMGWVMSLESGYYRWKREEGKYYIRIDGEWVLVPEGIEWEPGDPIPESMMS